MKLINKNGSWAYQDKVWNVPIEGSSGHIEDKVYGTVLGLRNDSTELGTMVELEIKDKPQSDEQRWVREMSDEDGWFRFKNPLSGRVLSVQTFSSITIAGKEINFIHHVFKLN